MTLFKVKRMLELSSSSAPEKKPSFKQTSPERNQQPPTLGGPFLSLALICIQGLRSIFQLLGPLKMQVGITYEERIVRFQCHFLSWITGSFDLELLPAKKGLIKNISIDSFSVAWGVPTFIAHALFSECQELKLEELKLVLKPENKNLSTALIRTGFKEVISAAESLVDENIFIFKVPAESFSPEEICDLIATLFFNFDLEKVHRLRQVRLDWKKIYAVIEQKQAELFFNHLMANYEDLRKLAPGWVCKNLKENFQKKIKSTLACQELFDQLTRLALLREFPFSVFGEFAVIHLFYPVPAFRPCRQVDILFDEAYISIFDEIAAEMGLKLNSQIGTERVYSFPSTPSVKLIAHTQLWYRDLHKVQHHLYTFENKPMMSFTEDDLILNEVSNLLSSTCSPSLESKLDLALSVLHQLSHHSSNKGLPRWKGALFTCELYHQLLTISDELQIQIPTELLEQIRPFAGTLLFYRLFRWISQNQHPRIQRFLKIWAAQGVGSKWRLIKEGFKKTA